MPQATMTYILSQIRQSIPNEILQLAFKPRKYATTIEQRIIKEIIEGPILLDTNLVGGKRRDIYLNASWRMDIDRSVDSSLLGDGIESSFYLVPPEARENRNISSVIGVTPFQGIALSGSGINGSGPGSFGNNATGMLSELINTRTFSNDAATPQITLEGTNIIRLYPEMLVEGLAISVFLEFDSEFLNCNQSTIYALRNLCLCAVQRYIATTLRVSIDESEVVAGMEIGVIKSLVDEYNELGKDYNNLLMKVKGSMSYDARSFSRIVSYAI